MKLYQINVEANYGSTGKIAEALGKAIQEDGGHAYLAHGRKHRASQLETYEVGNTLDYAVHFAKTRFLDQHGLASKNATKALTKHITAVNPDLIHLHNIHGYYLHYPTLFDFLKTLKKPVVWTLHDCWSFTGHCTHFEKIGCYKWKTQCEKCPQIKSYPSSSLLDNSYENYDLKKKYFNMPHNMHIITVSNWLKEQVKHSFLSKYDIKTIHNGLDTQLFKPKKNNTIRERFNLVNFKIILGVASVWSQNKGLLDFIKLSQVLNDDEKIVLIGLNKKQIKNLPLNIIGIERTQNVTDLINWYSTADVYVNASVEESFGLTTVEALACNTPVIVYNITANPEIINSKVGLCIEKNNLKLLREGITKILNVSKESNKKICRNHALLYFDQREQMASYKELYKKLLQN